ncbi:MAG: Uma2 family endonuclease [Methylocystis sp.]|jgi:Uma2 family endonuclease
MSALPKDRMSVEEYLAWSESQEGRYELVDGVVYAQAAERAAHAEMKGLVFLALTNAIRKKGLECRALVDGMAVRVGARTVFEPDAMVYCGPRLAPDAMLVDNPVIVVEVISPTSGRNDNTRKLAGYFALPSIRHYLVIDPDDPLVVHHERREDGEVVSHILREGRVILDPPGLSFELSDLYGAG